MKKRNTSHTSIVRYYDVDFEVEYDYYDGEDSRYYYSDMLGHPGSGPEVEINSIKINDQEVYDVLMNKVIDGIIEEIIIEHESR